MSVFSPDLVGMLHSPTRTRCVAYCFRVRLDFQSFNQDAASFHIRRPLVDFQLNVKTTSNSCLALRFLIPRAGDRQGGYRSFVGQDSGNHGRGYLKSCDHHDWVPE